MTAEQKRADRRKQGKKLRDLRIACGLTQKELGDKLELTRETISAYEHGYNIIKANFILKLAELTGIGSEYFESDMTLQEALDKYGIMPIGAIIKAGNLDDVGFLMYEGIHGYINNQPAGKMKVKFQLFSLLLRLDTKADYHFIRLSDSMHEPFAKKGDILTVIKAREAVNGDFVITRFQNSLIIFQYFVAGLDEVLFKGCNDIEIRLKGAEMKQIEILGIIKQKISTAI